MKRVLFFLMVVVCAMYAFPGALQGSRPAMGQLVKDSLGSSLSAEESVGFSQNQPPRYHIYAHAIGLEEGLPNTDPRFLFQDSQGYIWAMFYSGLYRFNGRVFQPVLSENQYIIKSGVGLSLFNGPGGKIWVVYYQDKWVEGKHDWILLRVDLVDPQSLESKTFDENFAGEAPFPKSQIRGITADRKGRLWMGLADGRAYCYEGRQGFRLAINNGGRFPLSFVQPASEDTYWALSEKRILELSPEGLLRQEIALPGIPFNFNFLGAPEEGEFYFQARDPKTRTGIKNYIRACSGLNDSYFGEYQLPLHDYIGLAPDTKGRLWAYGRNKLDIYERGVGKVASLAGHPVFNGKDFYVASVFFGQDGLAWACSNGRLLVISLQPERFHKVNGNIGNLRGIIDTGDGALLCNSYEGLCMVRNGMVVPLPKGIVAFIGGLGLAHGPDGGIWSAVHGNAILELNWPEQAYRTIPIKFQAHQEIWIGESKVIHWDERGSLWVGMSYGLARFDLKSETFEYITNSSIGSSEINDFYKNSEGLWMATQKGLILMKPVNQEMALYDSFPSNNFSFIHEDGQGIFWLASKGGGLIRWDRSNGNVKQYSSKDGLPNDIVHAVYEDSLGFLWLPTNNGLCRFNKRTEDVTNFSTIDGLVHNEFNFLSHFRRPDGALYMGGMGGLIYFHPRDFADVRPSTSPLRMDACWYQFEDGHTDNRLSSVMASQQAIIPPGCRGIGFEFSLLDYHFPEGIEYYYLLQGEGPSWKPMENGRLELLRLAPGKYTLRVKARTSNKSWSAEELAVSIEVLKPFYQKGWFFLLLGLLMVALVAALVRLRMAQLRREKAYLEAEVARRTNQLAEDKLLISSQYEELKLLNQTKDKLFALIGHELRGPVGYFQNVGKNLAFLIGKGQYSRAQALGESLEKTSLMMNVTLDNLLRWGLSQSRNMPYRPEVLRVGAIIQEVAEAFMPLAEGNGIELSVDDCLSLQTGLQAYADASSLQTIMRNLVGNAIKFTPAEGAVRLSCAIEGRWRVIEVADTGAGIPEERLPHIFKLRESTEGLRGEKGAGLGLYLCAELAAANGGKIEVQSREGEGTVFRVFLPGQPGPKQEKVNE
ncbi:MAG: hypothetical protein H6566_15015 [Lewinellaceae bacterium]|nr:hypothetical protein [Lewinellaceae bacterium]